MCRPQRKESSADKGLTKGAIIYKILSRLRAGIACREVRRFADDAALLRLSRSDQVAAERPSHHAFELAAQRTFQIETIWPD
jgi:hypothetical protein